MTMGDVQEPARLRTRWVSLLSEGSMRRLRPLCESDSETMGSGAWQSQSAILEAQNKRRYRE